MERGLPLITYRLFNAFLLNTQWKCIGGLTPSPLGALVSNGRPPNKRGHDKYCTQDLSLCAERWNNDDRGPPRSVLYLLYLKHDQKIDRRRKNNYCLYLPYDHGRHHVECVTFPTGAARKQLFITAFRQVATLVFATSQSNMDNRLIDSRNTTTIVFTCATTMHCCSFPLYKSINPSRTMSRPHHDARFFDYAPMLGAGPTPFSIFIGLFC